MAHPLCIYSFKTANRRDSRFNLISEPLVFTFMEFCSLRMKKEDGMWCGVRGGGEKVKWLQSVSKSTCLLGCSFIVHVQMERPSHTSTASETLQNFKTDCTKLPYRQYQVNFFFLWCYGHNLGLGLPPWNSPFHFGLLDLRHSVVLLGQVISSSQGRYLYKNKKKKRTHTQTPTSMPWVGLEPTIPTSERAKSAWIRPLGYRDRNQVKYSLILWGTLRSSLS
jgi:hypothetical protein